MTISNETGGTDDECEDNDSEDSTIPQMWYDIGDKKARDKVRHCLRDVYAELKELQYQKKPLDPTRRRPKLKPAPSPYSAAVLVESSSTIAMLKVSDKKGQEQSELMPDCTISNDEAHMSIADDDFPFIEERVAGGIPTAADLVLDAFTPPQDVFSVDSNQVSKNKSRSSKKKPTKNDCHEDNRSWL